MVGLYALALSLATKVDILNRSLRTVLLPAVSSLSSKKAYLQHLRQSLRRSLVMATLLVLGLPLAAPLIVFFYGDAYSRSVGVFYLLTAIVLMELFTVPLILLAYPMNMPRLIAVSDGLGVAVLIAAAGFLIPLWGMYGAALAKLAAKTLSAVVIGITVSARLRKWY